MRIKFFSSYLLAAVADICPRSDPARRRAAARVRLEAHRAATNHTKARAFGAPKPYAGETARSANHSQMPLTMDEVRCPSPVLGQCYGDVCPFWSVCVS